MTASRPLVAPGPAVHAVNPSAVPTPARSIESLRLIGRPCSGPTGFPCCEKYASRVLASHSADSKRTSERHEVSWWATAARWEKASVTATAVHWPVVVLDRIPWGDVSVISISWGVRNWWMKEGGLVRSDDGALSRVEGGMCHFLGDGGEDGVAFLLGLGAPVCCW